MGLTSKNLQPYTYHETRISEREPSIEQILHKWNPKISWCWILSLDLPLLSTFLIISLSIAYWILQFPHLNYLPKMKKCVSALSWVISIQSMFMLWVNRFKVNQSFTWLTWWRFKCHVICFKIAFNHKMKYRRVSEICKFLPDMEMRPTVLKKVSSVTSIICICHHAILEKCHQPPDQSSAHIFWNI